MEHVFLTLLNRGIAAGWMILAVIVLRGLLKKVPRWIFCLLWGLVAIRLICPFSLESIFSLVPSRETIPPETLLSQSPCIDSGIRLVDDVVNPVFSESFAPKPQANSANPLQIGLFLGTVIWGIGFCCLLAFALISYLRLSFRVRTAVRFQESIYLSEFINTPFILGILRPRIYLPSGMAEAIREPVLAHEQAHLKRKDPIWKIVGYLLLSFYWFQPLCWVAYSLFCKDIELACDEKVIRNYSAHQKKLYSEALLLCSLKKKRAVALCPLAFGEVGVKERIRSVLSYKKPAFWVMAVAVALCAAAAVCFLTDPAAKGDEASRATSMAAENIHDAGNRTLLSGAGNEQSAEGPDVAGNETTQHGDFAPDGVKKEDGKSSVSDKAGNNDDKDFTSGNNGNEDGKDFTSDKERNENEDGFVSDGAGNEDGKDFTLSSAGNRNENNLSSDNPENEKGDIPGNTDAEQNTDEEPNDDKESLASGQESPLDRFVRMDWKEIKARNLSVQKTINGNPVWSDVVCIGEIPQNNIALYGYNDADFHCRGVAIEVGNQVNYFDWVYCSARAYLPDCCWKETDSWLQVALNIYSGTGASAQELHILQEHDAGILEDNVFELGDYSALLKERVSFTYERETRQLRLFDTVSHRELAMVALPTEGNISDIELGWISQFQLGNAISLCVQSGYLEDGSNVPQYEGMPMLEAEILLQKNGYRIEMSLGEIREIK